MRGQHGICNRAHPHGSTTRKELMRALISILLAGLIVPAFASAATVVDDDFSDMDRSKTGALDADWWSSNSTSGNSVEIDASGLGLVSGTSGRGLHATFAPQNLGVGETLTVTYAFNTPPTVGATTGSSAFKVALMELDDVGLAADLSSSSSSANPLYVGLPGYMSGFDVGSGDEDVDFRKHDVTSASGRFQGTTSEWNSMGSSANVGYTFLPNTDYQGVFSVTRTGADSLNLASSMTQVGVGLLDSHMETDDSDIANNFGMFGIWANSNKFGSTNSSGDPDNGITLTRFSVELTQVPEPSTSIVLLGAIIALGLGLRRK